MTPLRSAAWIRLSHLFPFLNMSPFQTQRNDLRSSRRSSSASFVAHFQSWGLKPQVCFCHEALRGSTLNWHLSLIWLYFTSKTTGLLPAEVAHSPPPIASLPSVIVCVHDCSNTTPCLYHPQLSALLHLDHILNNYITLHEIPKHAAKLLLHRWIQKHFIQISHAEWKQ